MTPQFYGFDLKFALEESLLWVELAGHQVNQVAVGYGQGDIRFHWNMPLVNQM